VSNWADLQKHMRHNYRPQDDEADMMSMIWSYESGRQQKILIRRFSAAGQEMVEFKSAFARLGDVEPLDMLRDNVKLPLATVALSGNVFLVVYNVLLSTLSIEAFDFVLSRVAAVADTLEEKYSVRDEF
jgi:hypothetical protein